MIKSLRLPTYFVLLLCIPVTVSADGWIRTFGGPYWDIGYWVEVTSDSGFIICTEMIIEKFSGMGQLIKTDSLGYVQWIRSYDPRLSPEEELYKGEFFCVQQTHDGGYVASGKRWGPSIDVWLVKTDSQGVVQWTHSYNGANIDKGWCIRQTPDFGYVIAGVTQLHGNRDFWLLRTDSLGDTLWTRTYGMEESDEANCISLTSDGNYIVTGEADDQQALWLMKIDEAGEVLWEKKYYTWSFTWGQYVEETADGGFIVTGSSSNAEALYLLKTDEHGDSLWSRSYFSGGQNIGTCVHQTPDGGYIVCGTRDYESSANTCQAWLLKTDLNGDTLWTRTFGEPNLYNNFRCVQIVSNDGYVMTGKTGDNNIEYVYEPTDVWLVKTDSAGIVGVKEVFPVEKPTTGIGPTVGVSVTFGYANYTEGFHAYVFNTSGQRVDEIHSDSSSGTVTWGQGQRPGVYFIRELSGTMPVRKVILIK